MTRQKLFFSYSRADGAAFAKRLAADLQRHGFEVWIDQEDIKAGLQWDAEVEKALESCDCVLYLETEKSVVSNNVLDEVYYALEQNKKVIPLIVVDSKTPFRLKRLHHIDFTREYEAGLALLVNELNSHPQTLSYLPEDKLVSPPPQKWFYTKKAALFGFMGGILLLLAGLFLFGEKNESAGASAPDRAVILADTKTDTILRNPNERTAALVNKNEEGKKEPEKIALTPDSKRNKREQKAGTAFPEVTAGTTEADKAKAHGFDVKKIAGNWQLVGVQPKAKSHRGYLKIEAEDEHKATIKTYLQFYYIDSDASSYPTIFNAFAGCASCALAKEIKLTVEDIAVGSRTIKKLQEDQPDGRKAGEVALDAHANKSLRGTITLKFIDATNAVIKVIQPQTIALSDELTLTPFVYTFHLRKID